MLQGTTYKSAMGEKPLQCMAFCTESLESASEEGSMIDWAPSWQQAGKTRQLTPISNFVMTSQEKALPVA